MGCDPIISHDGQGLGMLCSRGARRARCKVCKTAKATKQCDYPNPRKKSGTCDANLCDGCAVPQDVTRLPETVGGVRLKADTVDFCKTHTKPPERLEASDYRHLVPPPTKSKTYSDDTSVVTWGAGPMRAIDVCCGAGGLSLGLQRAGWNVLGVEINPDAVETHRRHVGPCDLADITTWHPPGPAGLVVGGVPCTSFSVAGARAGLEDERGQLYRHLVRIAVEAEAHTVIMENVEGLLSTPGALAAIYAEMKAGGFSNVQHQVLCAADYGTPQKRYRVFIVGMRDASWKWKWPDATHGDGPMVPLFGLKPWVTVRQALGLGTGARRSGRLEGASGWKRPGRRPMRELGEAVGLLDQPSPTILTRNDCLPPKGRTTTALLDLRKAITSVLDQPAPTISGGGGPGGGAEPLANRKLRNRFLGELALLEQPALALGAGHDTYPDGEASRKLHEAVSVAGLIDRPATTIACDARLQTAGHHEHCNSKAVRLTVDQCARLQGFPSGWEWAGATKESQHAQVGNAVPPQLGEALGRAAMRLVPAKVEATE